MPPFAGECGEVCEIFQWKPHCTEYSEREVEHIGEEIADVLIYTTRLCDICHVDLAQAVHQGTAEDSLVFRRGDDVRWMELDLDFASSREADSTSRNLCFALQTVVGMLCHTFSTKTEATCEVGLPQWSDEDVRNLARSVGNICLVLGSIANLHGLSLSHCVLDKFEKNARKYPAHEARGSSAKYTAYNKSGTTNSALANKRSAKGSWRDALVTVGTKVALGFGIYLVANVIYGMGVNEGVKLSFQRDMRADDV
jgi:NTP pyrophosphatase (non-canonical NTP hydrolase)